MARRETIIAMINTRLRCEKSPLAVGFHSTSRPVDTVYYEVAFREHPHLQKTTPLLSQAFLLLVEEEAMRLGFKVEWNNLNNLFWMSEDDGAMCAECGGKDALDDYDGQLLCSYCRMRVQDAERE